MKKWMTALLLLVCLCGSFIPSAAAAEEQITEAGFYTANLYYCDVDRGVVVLQNVKPMGVKVLQNTQTAYEAEYNEIRISGSATMRNGTVVPLYECNRYADSLVRVLITKSSAGSLRVIQMKFF